MIISVKDLVPGHVVLDIVDVGDNVYVLDLN